MDRRPLLALLLASACTGTITADLDDVDSLFSAGESRISADNLYVRWAPGSATIDYFMQGDHVDVHGSARSGEWLCVTGTSRYGLRHTGWVLSPYVHRAQADGNDGAGAGECKYGPDDLGKFEVTFRNCRIKARGAFRYGPLSSADRITGDRAPDGFLDPAQGRTCLARASNSQGGTRGAEGDGYVWVAWRPDLNPNSNHAPGKTGWFREDLLDCSAGVSCADDVGNADPPEADPQEDPTGSAAPPPAPAPATCPFHKRWISSVDSFDTWRFDWGAVIGVDDAALATCADESTLAFGPTLVKADDSTPEVWVIDPMASGTYRRHVPDPATMDAWQFPWSSIQIRPAAEVYALPIGAEWPHQPVTVKGSGDPVYLVDY